ncbi:hypothetical protein PGT21_012704 [Puccinia graminis f. sp. tritici]|uniref:Uncharacterized protein n=1 Tax=Puccinia graminis f. sp. tritici TaxID=56615 RepID=A0A5B0LMU0_PUCGR|nr:hypothetical protein PGT21_012704 [Puccinia graminis f. sp. tritici]
MAFPKQKSPAPNDQRATSLELLKDSYQALEKFNKAICKKAQGVSLNRSPHANFLSIVQELLGHFKMIIDHQTGNPKDNARLVKDCPRKLPLRNLFSAIRPASPVKSSPILGLMSYIYKAKLEQCQGPFSLVRQACVNDDSEHIGQCWERVLAAFGEGIRVNFHEPTSDFHERRAT